MPKPCYVIKAVSGRETKVRENILIALKKSGRESAVENLLIPVKKVTEMKRGKKVTTELKLYPGYIYAWMDVDAQVLEVLGNVDGYTGFLGANPRHPEPVKPAEAEQVLKIATAQTPEEQRAAIVAVPFNLGDKVKVKEGTFAGMEGVIDEINQQQGTLRVQLTVFGRQTPLWLEVWQVEELA